MPKSSIKLTDDNYPSYLRKFKDAINEIGPAYNITHCSTVSAVLKPNSKNNMLLIQITITKSDNPGYVKEIK